MACLQSLVEKINSTKLTSDLHTGKMAHVTALEQINFMNFDPTFCSSQNSLHALLFYMKYYLKNYILMFH